MSNEADSYETVPAYRWAETNTEVPVASSTDLAEPSSGSKDLGFVADTPPNRAWINWLFWTVGVAFRYVRNFFGLWWVTDCVMPGCDTTEGVVTAGVGMSVNVTAVRVMISSQFYAVAAWTNEALSAADPSDDRYDLVVAKLSGGAPTLAIVEGTPGAGVPATPTGNVPLASVLVPAGGAAPTTIDDLRVFGELVLDRLEATDRLRAWLDTGVYNLRVDGTSGIFQINRAATTLLQSVSGPWLEVEAANFRLINAITGRVQLGPADFPFAYTFSTGTAIELDNYDVKLTRLVWPSSGPSGSILANLQLPHGATITSCKCWFNRTNNANDVTITISKYALSDGTATTIGTANYGATGAVGDLSIEASGLSEVVDLTAYRYGILVSMTMGDASDVLIYGAETQYTLRQPWLTA